MGGWPGMIEPLKMHGAFLFYLRPMAREVDCAFSSQWRSLIFKPYRVCMSWRYMFGGVMGQYLGGSNTYVSPSGKYAWQNACLKYPAFTLHLFLTTMVMNKRSLVWESTGSNTSLRDQLVGSRLPRTHMRYFSRWGLPLASVLMVVRGVIGRELPTDGLSCWCSSSEM